MNRVRRAEVFRAPAGRGAAAFGAVTLLTGAAALALVARAVSVGVSFAAFLSILFALTLMSVAAVTGYWTWALRGLRYEIADGALTIVWGWTRQVIPLAKLERLIRGRQLGLPRVEGLTLPPLGCHIGWAQVSRLGQVLFYSAHRSPSDILYLVTPTGAYGISPRDPSALIEQLRIAAASPFEMGDLRQELQRRPLFLLPLWRDRALLVAGGLAVALALAAIGVVFTRFPLLPDPVVLRFPDVNTVGNRQAFLGIAVTALALLLINTAAGLALHRILRGAAVILVAGGAFVQALLLMAAIAAA